MFIFETEENQMGCQMLLKTLTIGPLSLQRKTSALLLQMSNPIESSSGFHSLERDTKENLVRPKKHTLHCWEVQILRWGWEVSIQEYHQEETRTPSKQTQRVNCKEGRGQVTSPALFSLWDFALQHSAGERAERPRCRWSVIAPYVTLAFQGSFRVTLALCQYHISSWDELLKLIHCNGPRFHLLYGMEVSMSLLFLFALLQSVHFQSVLTWRDSALTSRTCQPLLLVRSAETGIVGAEEHTNRCAGPKLTGLLVTQLV